MSYCSLDEAFQTSIPENVLPPIRQQIEEPSSRGERGRLKPRKQKRSNLPPPEPTVIEPDRPAHRAKEPAELLGGGQPRNDESTSLSSYLIGAADPGEDYFPYPNGSGSEPGFDKQFMLEPNWFEQFQDRMPSPRSETPQLPGASVDGYNTLYQRIPKPHSNTDYQRNMVAKESLPGHPTTMPGASTNDPELRKRLDDLFNKMEQLDVSRAESNHSEIILFVMTGIFVLLMLDLLLKQGCRALTTIVSASTLTPPPMIRGGGAIYNNPFFL
jgi:hypothetical protein